MLPFEYVEKRCKHHMECKFCGWEGKPWELPFVFECIDWDEPKGDRHKRVRQYCPKCLVLDSLETKEDTKHYTEYRKMEKLEYKGYMSSEAQEFFEGNIITEQRDGLAVIGHFVKLSNGETCLPSKGDIFTKHEDGTISVETIYR